MDQRLRSGAARAAPTGRAGRRLRDGQVHPRAGDGPPAAGKTTLADELALLLRGRGREVIRATIESFMLPRAQRYRRGEYSPEACYRDSFDYDALRRVLLDPLGPEGDRRVPPAPGAD